jgi:hypothetical protein
VPLVNPKRASGLVAVSVGPVRPICAANSEFRKLLFPADPRAACAARRLRPQNLKTRHVGFWIEHSFCSSAGPTILLSCWSLSLDSAWSRWLAGWLAAWSWLPGWLLLLRPSPPPGNLPVWNKQRPLPGLTNAPKVDTGGSRGRNSTRGHVRSCTHQPREIPAEDRTVEPTAVGHP